MPNDCCADGDSEIRPQLPMISLSLSLVLNVIYFYLPQPFPAIPSRPNDRLLPPTSELVMTGLLSPRA
jgi:hypothetical protein